MDQFLPNLCLSLDQSSMGTVYQVYLVAHHQMSSYFDFLCLKIKDMKHLVYEEPATVYSEGFELIQ